MRSDTSTAKKVQYGYGNGTNTTRRRTGMTYVNGTPLAYSYGAAGRRAKGWFRAYVQNDD